MISEEKRKLLALFDQGLRRYKLMKFREARDFFAKALYVDPADGPSKKYLERCEDLIVNPPGEDWDGVYEMKTK